jgi:HSP20 family protein
MITSYTLNSLTELARLQREMNRLFDDSGFDTASYPALNIWSDHNQAVVTSEIPGVDIKDLNITSNNNLLTLEGERKGEELGEKVVYHRNERGIGRFVRTIRLPFEADNEKMSATYSSGVLKIVIPRAKTGKPRKIEIIEE